MMWIKEVEMVDSLEELKSRDPFWKEFPNVEVLDAWIAFALNKIIRTISKFLELISKFGFDFCRCGIFF